LSVFPDCRAFLGYCQTIAYSIEIHDIALILHTPKSRGERFQFELIHEQLPLPVPCYDLVPVTELTLGPANAEISGTPGSLDLTGGEYKT
jgi:hypothetical protein